MIFEAISALLAAVSIVFSRLDKHHDAAVATPDLHAGLLRLDGLLEEWLVAAQATNTAAATWLPASGDELEHRLMGQSPLAFEVLEAVQSPLGAGSNAPVNRDTASLRRLFEIYAPAESAHIAEWAEDRYYLVNRMLQDLARARQTQAPAQAKPWEAQLRESYDNLLQAQRQLREFIRSSFPLAD
jgi:hypothetical protein